MTTHNKCMGLAEVVSGHAGQTEAEQKATAGTLTC